MSELFQLLMKMFSVKKLRTTDYNPRANGLTENGNEFIKNYLASYMNYSDKEWFCGAGYVLTQRNKSK